MENNVESNVKSTSRGITNYLALFIILISIIFVYKQSKLEYIDGNILKLPLTSSVKSDTQSIGNPWKNASTSSQLVFRSLFATDSTLTEISPDLCSEYQISSDDLTYVITLKDNVKWSDGMPVTVDDIVFSIKAFMHCLDVNPNLAAAFNQIVGVDDYVAGKSEHITGLVAEGNTLTFTLKNRYNNFMMMLTQFVPLPEHILQDEDLSTLTSGHSFFVNETSVGNGMYKSTGLNDDYNLVLVKNPYYEGTQPKIDKVILYWDFLNIDIDFYHTTDITQIFTYRANRNYQEYLVDVLFYRYFVFNLADNNPAMQDAKVRQAITHAIDIKTLLQDIYYDTGTMIYGGSPTFANTQIYEYNPTKARQLLEDAGYDFDRTFKIIYYYNDATSLLFLERVSQYLEAVGVKNQLVKSNSTDDLYLTLEYDMMLKGLAAFDDLDWYNEYLSSNTTLSKLFGTEGEFDELIEQLSAVSDHDEYNSVLKELVSLEQSLVYKLPLFTLNQAVYINNNRLIVPDDMLFGNTRYNNNLRIDEWEIKRQ